MRSRFCSSFRGMSQFTVDSLELTAKGKVGFESRQTELAELGRSSAAPVQILAESRTICAVGSFADGAALDALLVVLALEDRVYVDAGCVDVVGIEFAYFDQVLYFGDYVVGGCGHHGIKIAGGFAIDEISPAIALPGFDEGEVAADAALEDVLAAVELAGFFSFGNHGAVPRRRVEGGDARAASADAFGKGALRV